MFEEVLKAAFMAGVPVAVATVFLAAWAIRRGHLDLLEENQADENARDEQAKPDDPVLGKWVAFGGGFYGLMALLTYIHSEAIDLWGSLTAYGSLSGLLAALSVGFFVDLFVEAMMNFVVAITWFMYWPDEIHMRNGWIWLGAAYVGYHVGMRIAQQYAPRATPDQED